MVSSRRRPSSSISSCSSSGTAREHRQIHKAASVDRERVRKGVEQLPVENEREVARRVLADLEGLYCDEGSDEGSDEESEGGVEDEYDSSSDWGVEMSSRSSHGKRTAGGMTLEELTVAVNAAIEYHLSTESTVIRPANVVEVKEDDKCSQYSDDHHPRRRCRQHRRDQPAQSGELVLEMFQDMLERKEKHFYALRSMNVLGADNGSKDNQTRELAATCTVIVDQPQQTTAFVRDQATETEDYWYHPTLDASFRAADFNTPPNSSPSAHSNCAEQMQPLAMGPTLADLANSHRRSARHRLVYQPHPTSESLWSSSSSSSATDSALSRSHSSFASKHSSVSSRSSTKSDATSQSSKTSSRTSAPSKRSRNSEHNSRETRRPAGRDASRQPTDWQFEKNQVEEILQAAVSANSSQAPTSPEQVKWELDLSNFTF